MSSPVESAALPILLVEDNPGDARLIVELIRDVAPGQFEVERMERLAPALERLARFTFGAVLLDLGLPDSHGMETFEMAQRAAPSAPIIIISGLDDETLALQAVRLGAQDYLVKGRLEGYHLVRVIRYAIERKGVEQELLKTDARYRALIENSAEGICVFGSDGMILYGSPANLKMLGYSPEELVGISAFAFIRSEDQEFVTRQLEESVRRPREAIPMRARVRHKDGSWRVMEGTLTNLIDEPSVGGIVNSYRDATNETSL
jgi:PAS domain S-box-containing protein